MSDIRTLELIPRPVQAVQFTGDNAEWLRQWIQDKLSFQNVVATETRLYLPSVGGVEVLQPGEWVFYDPKDGAFRGATDEAVQNFYVDVTEES